MIRKLKNILNKESLQLGSNPGDLNTVESQVSNHKHDNETGNSSPVNFIKRKIKSSKSWVKMPKSSKLFQEECVYATVTSPELASQEFETFSRNFQAIGNSNNGSSFEYGFSSRAPSIGLHSPLPSSIIKLDENNRVQKHSTLDTKCRFSYQRSSLRNHSNSCFTNSIGEEYKINDRESFFYFKIVQRLKKSSLLSPAHIPIICIQSFKFNVSKWMHLVQQIELAHRHDLILIDLDQGMPVNALFYLADFDLIYVRTADEREGYAPRDFLKPIVAFEEKNDSTHLDRNLMNQELKTNNLMKSCFGVPNTNTNHCSDDNNCKPDDDSIKYHSLSIGTDYEQLQIDDDDENPYSAIPIVEVDTQSRHQFNFFTKMQKDSTKNLTTDTRDTRDSGYRSDNADNASEHHLVNDYEIGECVLSKSEEEAEAERIEKKLENMQSRSRIPISISNSMNLTVMSENENLNFQKFENLKTPITSFINPTYKSPSSILLTKKFLPIAVASPTDPGIDLPVKFERSKIRRSLDSNLILSSQKQALQAVDIDIENTASNYSQKLNLFKKKELQHYHHHHHNHHQQQQQQPYPDLDINKIELDSIKETLPVSLINKSRKIWTVLEKYDANKGQEISVRPGMLVLVVRQYNSWLYVKLAENEYMNTAEGSIQMYGFIPRSCAVERLEATPSKSKFDKGMTNVDSHFKPRRSQITAL